ncbi:MAG TPA: CHAD domain-containing protein [Sphingomicrobium sp.]
MSREIELKLEVDPDELPLVRQDPFLAAAESRTDHQVTLYYDTRETALKKHGFTLRVRSVGGKFIQTVKPLTDSVGLVSREEIESEVGSEKPDLSVLEGHPIHALLTRGKAHKLEPMIRSDVNRTSWIIDRRHGNASMQVDLDFGTITAGDRCEEFAEIEFELIDGPPSSLVVAARRLSDHAPVRLGVLTKAERGFLVADNSLHKIHKAGLVDVNADMTIAEAFEKIVHECLKHYRLNEPLVIRKAKAEALHQGRVAMRRLRSAFTLFRPAIEDVEFQHLRQELRWFTAQLGDARNLDVYLERDLALEERDRITRLREKAYDGVTDAMNSQRFRRLLIDLIGWTAVGAWRSSKRAQRSVASFSNRRLDRLWHSITSAGRDIASMDETTRHELRIQGKKMRYAVEFLRGLYPHAHAEEKRFATAIEELQESLGKLNDIATGRTLGAAVAADGWLIGSLNERRHLTVAEEALRGLHRTGPFWRIGETVEHA